MTNHWRLTAVWAAFGVLVAAAVLFSGQDTATASVIVPDRQLSLSADYCSPAGCGATFPVCGSGAVVNTAPNTASDINGEFGIGIGPDCTMGTADDNPNTYNSAGLITFTPPEWGVAKDSDLPDGTKVGSFSSKAVLGLLNNSCNAPIPVNFTLLDATTNRSNTIAPLAPGKADRLKPMAVKDENGNPAAALKWPTYLTDVAAEDGMDLSKLRARFVGLNTTAVSGTTVVLNFLVFEPGAKISNVIALDPRLGYPAVTVLQDPSAATSAEDAVNDFCAPLETRSVLQGLAGGAAFRTNPPDGTYNFVTWVSSAPDHSGAGVENALNPCAPGAPDPNWNPRGTNVQKPGDRDGDGLPDNCDPFPDVPSAGTARSGMARTDEDGDGWMNRSDNCPLLPNADQTDTDSDGLGDACDPEPNDRYETNRYQVVCLVSTVKIGNGGTPAIDAATAQTLQPCGKAPLPGSDTTSAVPTPTLAPGQTPGPTKAPGSSSSGIPGVVGPPDGGIGSLSPTATSVPSWAAIIVALGGAGLLGGFGYLGARAWRRRN